MNGAEKEISQAKLGRRRIWLVTLTALFATIGIVYGVYWAWYGRFWVETDNAYVSGNIVQITPQTSGTVVSVQADDTEFVTAGTPLVRLDEADAKVTLEQAEAQLARTVREVRALYSNDGSLAAVVTQREADLKRVRLDLERRQTLQGTGAIAQEEIEHARETVSAAEAAVASARDQRSSNQALIDHTDVAGHPSVELAAARVREAYLAWRRATVPAPVTGYVAKRSVQVGQRVKAGDSLMALVPLDQVWVEANFKEMQLREMRIGQPVQLHSDLYGKKMVYHGKVAGFSAGTGSAFSLLPAQNATGNWIKVVQRLPVRIALDPKDLAEHPLQVGLSMSAEVDVRDKSGARLSSRGQRSAAAETGVFSSWEAAANRHTSKLIAMGLGGVKQPLANGTKITAPVKEVVSSGPQLDRISRLSARGTSPSRSRL